MFKYCRNLTLLYLEMTLYAATMSSTCNDLQYILHFAMIRLSGIIHVMYKALNMCLVSAHEVDVDANDRPRTSTPLSTDAGSLSPDLSPLSEEGDTNVRVLPEPVGEPSVTSPQTHITEKEARMAVSLTEYFQEQRSVYKHLKVLHIT